MSIKDRIKFFENLNNNKQPQPPAKPLPGKVIPKIADTTGQVTKPILSQSQPSQHKQKISEQNDKKQSISKELNLQILKSNNNILQPQKQQQYEKQDKKVQKDSQIQESVNINVGNIRKMFETKNFPIVQQAPTYTKSCIGPIKKYQPQGQKTTIPDDQQHKVEEKRISLPQKIQTDNEIKLTLKQRMKIAQMILAKTKAGPCIKHQKIDQPKIEEGQNKSTQHIDGDSQNHLNRLKVELEQQTQNLDEQGRGEHHRKQEDESDRLFKEALLEQNQKPATLLTGQSNNLHLGTRKTMARKRNHEEDFDDL